MKDQEKAEILGYLNKFSGVFNDMVQEVTQRVMHSQLKAEINPFVHGDRITDALSSSVQLDTKKFLSHQLSFLEKQQQLWQNAYRAMLGENIEALVSEEQGDKRFADMDWQGSPAFSYVKQAYLLNAEYVNQLVESLQFEDKKLGDQVRFYTRQLVSSMAPTNYVFTNPEVCREILATEGECLARGIDNFVRDLEASPSEAFKITQVPADAYTLGESLAYTPGKVVYRNSLIELIQYQPSTEQVHSIPLLIVPPFINKYYILDLDEKKSLVRWLAAQGFSVFMISWVNPNDSLAEATFEDYVNDGVIAALNVVEKVADSSQINVAGYCVGGTLLGITQSYLTAIGDQRINSLSFLTTLFDFSEPGEVGNYICDQMLPIIERHVESKGYLDGRVLALSFSLLRENNLFWSFFIENYLKGKDPMPFDILYWNSDSTNVPGAAYLFYLRNMYVDNKLIQPGGVVINGVDIDLRSVEVPSYCVAAVSDHIVLWEAAYRSASHLGGDVRFVLTESGHVAGIVNPASRNKYGHWINQKKPARAETWLAGAEQVSGSWWHDWRAWLAERGGPMRASLQLGNAQFQPLADAPGTYVKRRLESTGLNVLEMAE